MPDFWDGLRPSRLISLRRGDPPRWWPLLVPWDALTWVWFVGVVRPVRFNYQWARMWLARGNTDSQYWSPRLDDRVDACMSPPGSVVMYVSIRDDVVITNDGQRHSLVNCCSPHIEGLDNG